MALIEGIEAERLLADKEYDRDAVVQGVLERGMNPVIPPGRKWREQREYDRYPYRLRHLVESGFCEFKVWRGKATRYAKKVSLYLANCHIRAILIRAKII
ncbi:MAG: transposase [Chloroflexi bacterium]|nr:transposase [Chloroflexota bacterium]